MTVVQDERVLVVREAVSTPWLDAEPRGAVPNFSFTLRFRDAENRRLLAAVWIEYYVRYPSR